MSEVNVENLNLNEVDPSFKAIEEANYKLQIKRMTLQKSDSGVSYVKGMFAVADHPKHAGRRLYNTFFLKNAYDQKGLRRIMDATGIQQTGTLEDWLAKLTTAQPFVKVAVRQRNAQEKSGEINPETGKAIYVDKVDLDGNPVPENVIDFREVGVA